MADMRADTSHDPQKAGQGYKHGKYPPTTIRHAWSQVDFEVWSRAHNFFNFETLTPIKAKGYVDPVPVFRPLGQALADDDSEVGDGVAHSIVSRKGQT